MAQRKIVNNTILLFIGTAADALDIIVCGTSIGLDLQVEETTSNTFCGADVSMGTVSGSIAFEGVTQLDPDSGKVSGANLFTIMMAKTPIFWKIGPAIPVTDDIIKEGEGYISALSEGYTVDADSTFNLTITIKGTPTQEVFVGVTAISVTPPTVTLAVAATQQITTTFTPASPSDTGLTYSTSDASKATVSVTGLITAVATGSATITVTSDDGSFTDTVVVTVS